MRYLQLDLTKRQREVCNRLLECRDKEDIEYATHAYIEGLYDAFRLMVVLFPDKWDTVASMLLFREYRLKHKNAIRKAPNFI